MTQPDDNHTLPDESADLAEAGRVFGPFEAELLKNFLESHGIACVVRGRTAPFVYPFTVDGLAEFKLMVQEKDVEKAKDLIAAKPFSEDETGPKKAD